MLTYDDVKQYLKHVTYRPGWTINVYDQNPLELTIRIVGTVEDSYHPGQFVDLGITSMVPPMEDLDMFGQWLTWRLRRIAVHESDEWFKIDGKPLNDPHKEMNYDE